MATQTNTDRQTHGVGQTNRQAGEYADVQTNRQAGRHLVLAAQLFPLVLVTSLEGVPVALAAAAPSIVAQGAQEDRLPAQHHSHTLHTPTPITVYSLVQECQHIPIIPWLHVVQET